MSEVKTPQTITPQPEKPKFKFPTEIVDLPSKGLIYPKDNPLSSGKVEMKYMTAKEEDILTNQNYIQKGIVIEKLISSLIVSDINPDDLIIGDKNALLVASRVLGYGKDYEFEYGGEKYNIDLASLENKEIDYSMFKGENEFPFTLPHSGTMVTFRLMTEGLEKKIDAELRGLKKINRDANPEMSTRMKYLLLSVDGNSDRKDIREFVDTYFLARDAKALREHIVVMQPDVDFKFERELSNGDIVDTDIPIGASFFFPNP